MDRMEVVRAADDRDTYYINMGPQHPSTHGVLRLRLHLDGERIINAEPIIGYGHRAHEKMAENRDYLQFLPNTSRVDYLSGMIYNLAYCQAIEKAMEIEVPERAEYIRIIAGELNRVSSHLLWLGTFLLDLGGITPFLYCFDDREARRRVHKAILLDEPSRELVDSCKSFLQASVNGAQLYQSPTQRFTRWVCIYQTAIIICTNAWVEAWEWDTNAEWIRENEVRIDVTDFMYEKPST